MPRQAWFDGLAAGTSLACLIHCLALPLLIALIPALSELLRVPESFHRVALAFAVPASALALFLGYRRHHLINPVFPGVAGLALMASGAFAASSVLQETVLTVVGSLLVAAAHYLNWRLSKKRLAIF